MSRDVRPAWRAAHWLAIAGACCHLGVQPASAEKLAVGSKKFTESVVLAEIARLHLAAAPSLEIAHHQDLGGTRILWKALVRGDIDVYPEYTGTLTSEILRTGRLDHAELRRRLMKHDIGLTAPLGFDNTYALGMRKARARELGITQISELTAHPGLQFGLTSEFMDRSDGWPGLRGHYGLPQRDVRGLDHDLAYRGLVAGQLDVIDLYSTDAEIAYYDLAVLLDDRDYFPHYEAVYLYRKDVPMPVQRRLAQLAERLDAETMRGMNADVKIHGKQEAAVAYAYLSSQQLAAARPGARASHLVEVARHTRDHIVLVATSLVAAIALALPLGVLAARRRRLGQLILSTTGVLQTVPSLALLVMMIPLLGIGAAPAIAALFLYSLLPIVRSTHAGLATIPVATRESAAALGLDSRTQLLRVELPLATPNILSGIKTAAVINVGTATLGALVGAGGYGQPILTGIRLDDTGLIMSGAVPAALLALAVQALFDLLEKRLTRR